jgi:hypothetical protein
MKMSTPGDQLTKKLCGGMELPEASNREAV